MWIVKALYRALDLKILFTTYKISKTFLTSAISMTIVNYSVLKTKN